MSDNIMTRQGYEDLKEKLRRMKTYDLQDIIKEVQIAAAHGDLSENAEYTAAKEKKAFIETRIREMEQRMSNATVIDTSTLSSDKVVFGATVLLQDDDKDEQVSYTIVA